MKTNEYRSRKINTPVKDLVVCLSKTPKHYDPIPGLTYGKAIGLVDVVACKPHGGEYVWRLENPRMIEPFDVHATASFFYVENEPVVVERSVEGYHAHILPEAYANTDENASFVVDAMFDKGDALVRLLGRDELEWL